MKRLAIEYLFPGLDFNHDAFIIGAIRKDLTRNLGKMQPAMIEDIHGHIDDAMGLDTESWHEVCVEKTMEAVVFPATNRILVGSGLSTNDNYLHHSISFATWLGGATIMVGQYTPWMIKPLFGYLLALPIFYHRKKALNFLLPVIQDRINKIKRKRADQSFEFEEPRDLITWMAIAMLDHTETRDNPPEFVAVRLLFFVSCADSCNDPILARLRGTTASNQKLIV